MKTVFSSHKQLSETWAKQTQPKGRCSNMFFENQVIYSYGYHYEIAHFIETPNGQKVCFINSNGFSSSTSKHTNHVFRSIPKDILTFYVPFTIDGGYWYKNQWLSVENLPKIINKMMECINTLISKQLTARTNSHYFSQAYNQYAKALHICELFNLENPVLPQNWFEAENKSNSISYKLAQVN
jgi:hypothetical protein